MSSKILRRLPLALIAVALTAVIMGIVMLAVWYATADEISDNPAGERLESTRAAAAPTATTPSLQQTSQTPPEPTVTPPDVRAVSIPGTIEAEDYGAGGFGISYHDTTAGNSGSAYRDGDVDIEASGGPDGSVYVGEVESSEWLAYEMAVPRDGTYVFSARVATALSGRFFHLEVDGKDVTGPMTIPNTGGWEIWANVVSQPVQLSAGEHELRLAMDTGGFNIDGITVTRAAPMALPGRVEAEDYRAGGEGVGYHDSTPGNNRGAYRYDDVDIQYLLNGEDAYVGWIERGEWLTYNVEVQASGSYAFTARVASPFSGKRFHIEIDGRNIAGSITVPSTGSWQNWTDVSTGEVALEAGVHTLRVLFETTGMNLDYIEVHSTGVATVHTLPGRIEAEAYRPGGPDVGFNDTTDGNAGGACRSDAVDLQAAADSAGCQVVCIAAGEWLAYDVTVETDGEYVFTARVATEQDGRTLHIEIDGEDVSGPLAVPNTGDWQSWADVSSDSLPLQAGTFELRIVMDTAGFNLDYVDVNDPSHASPAAPGDAGRLTGCGVGTGGNASLLSHDFGSNACDAVTP